MSLFTLHHNDSLSENHFHHHLRSMTVFLDWRFASPKPPLCLGMHNKSHFIKCNLFFPWESSADISPQKNCLLSLFMEWRMHFGILNSWNQYNRRLFNVDSIRTFLPAWFNELLFYFVKALLNLPIRGFQKIFFLGMVPIVAPRYLIGKEPTLHPSMSAQSWIPSSFQHI